MLFVGLGAEKYLQEAWPLVKGALKEYGISCELNLVRDELSAFFLNCYRVARLLCGNQMI